MEFKPQDIAKLVLGYLRQEKCQTAFCEFLTSSQYLKEHVPMHRRGKFIVTRVNGLSLLDYLAEYALVYSIVQEHVEASDYYDEKGLRTSLAQQLLYLLNRRSCSQSRTSTPIPVDVIIPDQQENGTTSSKSTAQPRNTLESLVNNSFEIINSETSATSIHSLPGNSSAELSFRNSSRNKSGNVSQNANKSQHSEADSDNREKSQEMCKEIFTQTFLDHEELIEKLADNINKEVSAKSSSLEHSSNFLIGQELDSTTIDTIIQRIAEDPIIVHSVEEMIGSGEDGFESNDPSENILTSQDKAELNRPKEQAPLSTPRKTPNMPTLTPSLKSRLRSSKKLCTNPPDSVTVVEEQNNEAVQSVVAASLSGRNQPVVQGSLANSNTQTETTPVAEVIVTEQPYDNFIHTGALAGPSNQNQIYVNSGGLLMMQPSVSSTCSNMLSAKNVQVDAMKPYYVIGNQPFGNVIIPQSPFKVSNVMTEQEIMAMPTIIVCDSNQEYSTTQPAIVQAPITNVSTSQTQPRTIAPKPTAQKAHSLSEYISIYQCNDPSSPIISQPQMQAPSPNLRSKVNATSSTKTNPVKRKSDKKTTQASKAVMGSTPAETAKPQTELTCNAVQELEQDSSSKTIAESMPQIVTPKMTAIQIVTERRSRSTPRNSSHVRQLDFSTPDKWGPIVRRAHTSPKVNKILESKDTPLKAPKSGTSKSIRNNLFKSPEMESIVEVKDVTTPQDGKESEHSRVEPDSNAVDEIVAETSTPQAVKTVKSSNISWDADLRAALATSPQVEENVQKQKRKRSEESSKEHGSSKKPKEILNKTEEDAAKIEIALAGGDNQIEVAETVLPKTPTETKNVKSVSKRRNRKTKKKAKSPIIKTDNEKQTPAKTTKGCKNFTDNNCADAKVNNVEDVKPKLDHLKVTAAENTPEKQYAVINRHVKSRIKKKCNMENSVKKTQMPEEIVLTNITKIKSCEILDESKNKLILSPSKLNANKRTLVEMENRSPSEPSAFAKVSSDVQVDPQEATSSKFVTPEFVKTSTNIPPSTAKRNIMPILETPVKFDSIIFPKTPSICTPSVIDTPFTKAVLDQLTGVDISTIPTPKFPITPNVPFTPAVEQSPFSNRATDYSTSSSYYQPSDNEQNKSLEQLIEECRKMDHQVVEPCKETDDCDGTLTTSISPAKAFQELEILETSKKTELNELFNTSKSPEVTNTSVTDKMRAFNHSMIGKKNLQLVKMFSNESEKDESSSSDTSSTGTSSTSSSSDSDTTDSDGDEKPNVTPRYSLRSQKSVGNNSSADVSATKETKKCQNTTVDKEQDATKPKEKSLSFHDGLLQEMEEKRLRTIARFKNANTTPKQKNTKVGGGAKKDKLKASTNKNVVSNKVTAKKTSQPKENNSSKDPDQAGPPKESKLSETSSQNENSSMLKQILSATKTPFVSTKNAKATVNDEKEIILHLSSDDENIEPSRMVEAVLLECSTSSTSVVTENSVSLAQCAGAQPASALSNSFVKTAAATEQDSQGSLDQESETWVKLKGLMQMGIHLIPNKPTKKLSPEETEPLHFQTKENISEKTDQSAKPGNQAATKEKAKKPEKQSIEVEGASRKPSAKEQKNKLNRSIEEGELISDDDKSPEKEKKYQKHKRDQKAVPRRRTSEPSRINTRKESTSLSDKFKKFRELYRYRPKQVKEPATVSESKKLPSSKNSKPSENELRDKSTELCYKAAEKATEIQPKNKTTAVPEKQVVEDLDYQVQFGNRVYTQETYRVAHDYSKEVNRTLSDYNLDILTKKFSANVYIAAIDSEVEKFLTFTPFEYLVDVSPEKMDIPRKSSNSYVSKEPLRNKKKPLTILYNQLIKPAEETLRPSVLEDLYDAPETSRNYKKGYELNRERTVSGSRKSEKSEKSSRSKHKSVREKSSDEEQSHKKYTVRHNDHTKTQELKSTSSPKNSGTSPQLQVESINQDRTESACGDSTKGTKLLEQDLEVVDGVIMLNANDPQEEEHNTSFEANDELMNYALVGSERVDNEDDVLLADNRKRKACEEEGENQQEKKQKTEELLRNIDVDSFLKKLHGEM